MNLIHKTSVIHEDAVIGVNVTIGEYTVIYSGTQIENNVTIGSHCSIGTNPEKVNYQNKSKLIIKEGTIITDSVVINLGIDKPTIIGTECFIMNHTYIAHDSEIGDRSILTPGVKVLGNVIMGKEVYLGTNSTVHQGSILGDLSLLGANSFCKGELLRGITYVGNPAKPIKINEVGLNRSKLPAEIIEDIRKSCKFNF